MKRMLIALAAVALCACGGGARPKAVSGEKAVPSQAADMHTAETSLDYRGVYRGTFPAADCPGIETTLTLGADGAYTLHMKYIDRDSEFDESGKYDVRDNLLTLMPSGGGSAEYYKVEENRLRRLDAEKRPVAGVLADCYVLDKSITKPANE